MKKKYILAIDLGGTNLKIGLLNAHYNILYKKVLSTQELVTKDELILAIIDSVNIIRKQFGLKKSQILGVGLGLPGPINVEKGLVHFFPNIPGWKEVALKSILEKKLKLAVQIDNDANLMCLAEYRLGAAAGSKNAVCITLGTGVGAGLIINATLYRASTFAAGEIGHIPINEAGPKCNCGGIACLETYIGNNRIKARANRIFGRNITLEESSALAKKRNRKAVRLWSDIGQHLGVGLVGVVNLLNPDCIVIGGGVAQAGSILLNKARQVIKDRAMKIQAQRVKVLKAKLGSDAGLIGAAILVKEGIY